MLYSIFTSKYKRNIIIKAQTKHQTLRSRPQNHKNLNLFIRSLSDFVEVIALAIYRYDSREILDRKPRDRLWAKLRVG